MRVRCFFLVVVLVGCLNDVLWAQQLDWKREETNFRAWSMHKNSRFIFAGSNSNGIARSSDDGETWERFSRGLPGARVATSIVELDNILFCSIDGSIFRSFDNGESWLPILTIGASEKLQSKRNK
jgi:photosystem II stability/assembly factor-like uncharacterized protein